MKKDLLIFGAEGALGKGISRVLTSKGYDKIYLLDFNLKDRNYPGNVEYIEYKDLSKEENHIAVFEHIKGGKDKNLFLYSTVGGYFGGAKTWQTEGPDMERMFEMNFKSSFYLAKHFSLKVREANAGSILFTAAYTGVSSEAGKSVYGASKRALISLVETLDLEGREINLTANAIAPYIIDTPANRSWGSESDTDAWIKPSEIGEFAHFVFSNFHFVSGNIFKLKTRLSMPG